MGILNQLESLGLNSKEAAIFSSTLELGPSSVLEISRHSHIKRSTVYVVLDELKYKKLVREIQKAHTTLFYAEHPSTLEKKLSEQLQTFRTVQPLLVDLYNKKTSKPNVKFYFGKEELHQLYLAVMEEYTHVDFIGTDLEGFYTKFPETFLMMDEIAHDGKHFIREIDTNTPFNIRYAKKRNDPKFHKIRILKNDYTFFGDNALYGNSVLITSPSEPFAVTIESKDVSRTFRALFDIAWSVSAPIRDASLRGKRKN